MHEYYFLKSITFCHWSRKYVPLHKNLNFLTPALEYLIKSFFLFGLLFFLPIGAISPRSAHFPHGNLPTIPSFFFYSFLLAPPTLQQFLLQMAH